jgi:rod shape determining protein RodA
MAKYLSKPGIRMQEFGTKLVATIIMALPAVIIILQNETGSALVYGALVFVLYREGLSGNFLLFGVFIAILFLLALLFDKFLLIQILTAIAVLVFLFSRYKKRLILPISAILIVCSGFIYSVDYIFQNKLKPHQKKRIEVLLGKETDLKGAGYNVHQSMIAIGSGGFLGKGFLQGTQTKYNFVPEQSTDFIFCTIGEEWGFLGTLIIIGVFVFFIIRIIYVAERQRSQFSRIYGYAIASIFFFHFAINIGMTIGLAPVIGIPLPFFSYGGSSLWSFTILLFIFIKLDKNRLLILQ